MKTLLQTINIFLIFVVITITVLEIASFIIGTPPEHSQLFEQE